jgi:hypothetical protein
MAKILLKTLKCIKQTDDGAGKEDEIYLKLKTDGLEGRLPSDREYWDMTRGSEQKIDREYVFLEQFTVTLMEHDGTRHDVVGEYTFVVQVQPAGSPLVFTGHDGEYHLEFDYNP